MENICDYKNCKKIGQYKAPVEKDNSKKFRWLCLDHIKEFNRSWDYFKGMSDQEVCMFLKSDMTWHKPTQSFSSPDNFFNILWKKTYSFLVIIEFYKYHNPLDSLITKYARTSITGFKPDPSIFVIWSFIAGFLFYMFTLFKGKYKFFILNPNSL